MSHWIIVPIILPALIAPLLVLSARYDIVLQRVISLASVVFLLGVTVALTWTAAGGTVEVYEMGNWPAPFGIVMVLDRLSAMMVLMTSVLGLVVLLYVIGTGWDRRGRHFHALFLFQLMGLYGAMLTGDLFNLFVFFEVLLIASYGLMVHGGGKLRLQAGVQYVIYNLAGSTLFLFALATLYGVTGTLNMADMAVKAPALAEGDAALLRTAAAMLLIVFAVKGALVPIHFWLPNTYTHAPAPVAALFAIMTKVGAYAVIRVYTLVFGPGLAVTNTMPADWILPAALVTLIIGMAGVLAGGSLSRMASFAAIGSMGTLFIAISAFTPEATLAALYYMVHSTFAGATLFLIVDLVQRRRGSCALDLRAPMAQSGLIAAMFFAAAIATAGMPPLSGFLGKLLVLDALRSEPGAALIWTVILATSLIAVLGFARAGSMLFWKPHSVAGDGTPPAPQLNALPLVATGAMLALLLALTVLAGPLTGYMEATSAQLYDTSTYIEAVLGTDGVEGTQ
ncbi:monovalent cation/H+ antiporter subunit D [Roseicitreum antarcticum]|uniref:monovalent cation/H+ antiporter subunit D n=1 Tax=Roseicitreum antarcticum TaxID=564137 RepID=UPI000B8178CB|nr:monovalent cation/H+ antiporter subunit D [Roseicitreum antarcticum]